MKEFFLNNKFIYLYLILAILTCLTEVFNLAILRYITKPLLCLTLLVYFIYYDNGIKNNTSSPNILSKLVCCALVFSCMGDTLLILPQFFVFGLVAFLIAHVSYVLTFYKDIKVWNKLKNKRIQATILLVIIYLIIFYSSIQSKLFELKIPVITYMIIISLMFILALLRDAKSGYISVLIGALLFVISDSFLAIDKFVGHFYLASLVIMMSYLLAQFLIIYGLLRRYSLAEKITLLPIEHI